MTDKEQKLFEKFISKNSEELQEKMHTLNDEQKEAMYKMMIGKNCFITGDAGTGKSYVINLFTQWCEEGNRRLLKTAPTGKASVNIGGVTTHSLFGLPLRTEEMIQPTTSLSRDVEKKLKGADRVVIDECSMLRIDAFEKVMKEIQLVNEKKAKKGERPIQVVLVGDFGQLPPVITKEDKEILNKHYGKDIGNGYCFQSAMWKEMGFLTVSFKQVVRQADKEFAEALTKCKYGDNSCVDYFNKNFKSEPNENAIWLFGKNKSAFDKNQECMQKLPSRLQKLETEFDGEFTADDGIVEKDLWLKEGCRVLITANDRQGKDSEEEMRYCNGSMGTLLKINPDSLTVLLDDTNEKVTIEKMKYEKKDYRPETIFVTEKKAVLDENGQPVIENGQPKMKEEEIEKQISKLTTIGTAKQFPVKVGYAITVHKSQGMTLDKVNYRPEVFAEGQFYVAMSRCKDIHSLYCEGVATPRMVKTSSEFLKFIKNPNNYSFFSETDIQRQNNKANGIDENQLSFDTTPSGEPQFNDIPKKKGGFGLNSLRNKFLNKTETTEKSEPEPITSSNAITEKSFTSNADSIGKNLTSEDKEVMLGKLVDSFASNNINKNKQIDISNLGQLINADSRIAEAVHNTLIDCLIEIRKEISSKEENEISDFDAVNSDYEEFAI